MLGTQCATKEEDEKALRCYVLSISKRIDGEINAIKKQHDQTKTKKKNGFLNDWINK